MLLERNKYLKSSSELRFSLSLHFLHNIFKEKDVIIKPNITQQLNYHLTSHKGYPSIKKYNSLLLLQEIQSNN